MKITTLLLSTSLLAFPLSVVPLTDLEKAEKADAVVVAKLVAYEFIQEADNTVPKTKFIFQTSESWKGDAPEYFECISEGGLSGDVIFSGERLPDVSLDGEYLLFLCEHPQGYLTFFNDRYGVQEHKSNPHTKALDPMRKEIMALGSNFEFEEFTAEEPTTVLSTRSVTSNGLLETAMINGNEIQDAERRFTLQDSGVGIPVIADVSTLPDGLSESMALTALTNALSAWESQTSVIFDFQGTEVFSQAANSNFNDLEQVIRIQFHDNFNNIANNSTTLGIGGARFKVDSNAAGDTIIDGGGGNVNGLDCFLSLSGFVIIENTQDSLSNASDLENVLCHEIGHVLGLAHSSENANEPDPTLSEAQMYFRANLDGRGADLQSYDINTARLIYPADTPPVSHQEFLKIVTAFDSFEDNGINSVELEVFDLQTDSSTFNFVEVDRREFNGTFTVNGSTVSFSASGAFNDSGFLFDFENGQQGGEFLLGYFTDGINRSPLVRVSILQFLFDSRPAGTPDGLPDSWVATFFGSPGAASFSGDPDGDGLTNHQEFLLNTDPTDRNSGLPQLFIDSQTGLISVENNPFAVFNISNSSDLAPNSFEIVTPFRTTRSNGFTQLGGILDFEASDREFFRLEYTSN